MLPFFLNALAHMWSISVVSASAWQIIDCPALCKCELRHSERFQEVLKTVDCFAAKLTSFPENLPPETQVLILRQNKIRLLPSNELWLPDLLHLDLAHNFISSLTSEDFREHVFEGVYNLRVLDLSFNQIRRLRGNDFRGLFNLEELNLADNKISSISESSLHGLIGLETLRLTGNRLTIVQPSWLATLRRLSTLLLNRNQLTILTGDNFHALKELVTLDLSRNKIFRIQDGAFSGLVKLDSLRLSSNVLTSVPNKALQSLDALRSINLSQNPIFKIATDDFYAMSQLRDINLSTMQRLALVERGAFKNLPELLVVEMHDNPYLNYVDRLSFINAPMVSHLFLHNNNLTTVEEQLVAPLSNLLEVSMYGNPLRCDCNVKWLRSKLAESVGVVYHEAERMICDSPAEHKYKLFITLQPEQVADSCAPTILYTFPQVDNRKPGNTVVYDCRAVGVPTPTVTWISPQGEKIDPNTYHPRRSIINGHSLVIRRLTKQDEGTYRCLADNGQATVQAAVALNVTELQVHLFPVKVSVNSVTVTWNGTDKSGQNVFQIFYRSSHSNGRHQYAGTVTPIMRSYTIQDLQPNSDYDVCIAMEDGDDVVVHLSCKKLTTLRQSSLHTYYGQQQSRRQPNTALGAALGIAACVLIVLCLSIVAVLKARALHRRSGAKFSRLGDFFAQMETGAVVASLDQLAQLKARGYSIV